MHERKQEKKALTERLQIKTDIVKSEKPALSGPRQAHLNYALLKAVEKCDNAETLRLIKAGADIAAKDDFNWTPLHQAAHNGYAQICALLIQEYAKAGGDIREIINAKDNRNSTAMQYARLWQFNQIVQFLESIPLFQDWMGKETFKSFVTSFRECTA